MNDRTRQRAGRRQLLLIAVVFLGPLLVAAWMYYQGGAVQPQGRTNNGALLEPIKNLADELPDSAIHAHYQQSWVLLYSQETACDDACEYALYTLRQSRLMLGKDMDRLTRVFLHGNTPPDTVFLTAEHAGLMTIEDGNLTRLLKNKIPAKLPAQGYYLIDPLGNLVMYFRPDLDPSKMVDDIKHLLKLSRIG
jgi:cytochrome oxidase Cu insertion factor (SCO1/SenC/PrrC family)